MNKKTKLTIALAGFAGILVFISGLILLSHANTIESHKFCDFCHTQYYDVSEYEFNDNVGMKKPSGVLVGCAECHPQPYQEFKESPHFDTELEARRPGCTNCHVPHSFSKWFYYMYMSPPEWERVQLSIHDNTLWEEEVRPDLALKARKSLVVTKSQFCKDCHVPEYFKIKIKAHKKALAKVEDKVEELNCVSCHYNFVHGEAPWDDKKGDIKRWMEEAK